MHRKTVKLTRDELNRCAPGTVVWAKVGTILFGLFPLWRKYEQLDPDSASGQSALMAARLKALPALLLFAAMGQPTPNFGKFWKAECDWMCNRGSLKARLLGARFKNSCCCLPSMVLEDYELRGVDKPAALDEAGFYTAPSGLRDVPVPTGGRDV